MDKENFIQLLKNIKIAKLLKVEKHPNADRLMVTQISINKDLSEPIQIVTGATNIKEGDLVPYLGVGFVVPGFLLKNGEEIKLDVRNMRGLDSFGMILAEDEIGTGDDHTGIMVLDCGDEMIGEDITKVISIESLDFEGDSVELDETSQKKLDLIVRDLAEVIGQTEIEKLLLERDLRVYWGTAPTGRPHLGYFVPLMKVADLLNAGCEVTILFANIHAFLDNMKSTWELLDARTVYYQFIIKEILTNVGVDLTKLKFVTGKDYQLSEKYTFDVYKVAALASLRDVKKAGAEVVKQVDSPLLSSMLYPILQALDEEYLDVDIQLGGVDQRKIFMFAREYLPKVGYRKRSHLMNVLIPGLGKSGKMSSSEPNSKIDLDDSDEIIDEKINKSFSVDKVVEGNGLLAICKLIIFKYLEKQNRSFDIKREVKWGGDVSYKTYEQLEKDFISGSLSSVDLKPSVANELKLIIGPLRQAIEKNKELLNKAYPKI